MVFKLRSLKLFAKNAHHGGTIGVKSLPITDRGTDRGKIFTLDILGKDRGGLVRNHHQEANKCKE